MFFKLCKLELKCSYRNFLILFAVGFVASLFMNPVGDSIVNNISVFLYAVCIFSIMIMCFLVIFKNYYSSMFLRESYLTHTLPVTTTQLLLSKLVCAVFWIFISSCFVFLTLLITGLRLTDVSIGDIFSAFDHLDFRLEGLLFVLYLLASMLVNILVIYFIMNVVHTTYVKNHRILIAIALYLVLSFTETLLIEGILAPLLNMALPTDGFMLMFMASDSPWLSNTLLLALAYQLLKIVLFFFASKYIIDHKLEIE